MLAALSAVAAVPGAAQVRLTQEAALRLAFPAPALLTRQTAYLTGAQLARVAALAGRGVDSPPRVVTYYVARRYGGPAGVAYFDAHRVRTLREVLMIIVSPAGRVDRIEVLKFEEPPEYAPADGWMKQLEGRELSSALSSKGSVANMTGATLTSNAVVAATRRVLALHAVIRPFGSERMTEGSMPPESR